MRRRQDHSHRPVRPSPTGADRLRRHGSGRWTSWTGLVASHLEERLLQPERLETILATVLDRRQERSDSQCEHIAELNRRAAESEARLKRLYDAIEAGIADLDDPALKDGIDGLKAIRDQAKATPRHAPALGEPSGHAADAE